MEDAARRVRQLDIGALPICDGEGHPVGIITDRDIVIKVIALGENPKTTTAGELGKLVGIITEADHHGDSAHSRPACLPPRATSSIGVGIEQHVGLAASPPRCCDGRRRRERPCSSARGPGTVQCPLTGGRRAVSTEPARHRQSEAGYLARSARTEPADPRQRQVARPPGAAASNPVAEGAVMSWTVAAVIIAAIFAAMVIVTTYLSVRKP